MADPTDPIPDSPPSEPFDVQTSPDSSPREPFDVKVSPDAPPRDPFDVQTSPDGPPLGTFDVAVFPDGPPLSPVDVKTFPDTGPSRPFDVATSPDLPPAAPIDVPTSPDSPPRVPVDVPVSPDAPPAKPVDVATSPDGPPRTPVDVPISRDLPVGPNQVWIGDGRLESTAQYAASVATPPIPTVDLRKSPTLEQIISEVKRFDGQLANFLSTLSEAPDSFREVGGSIPYIGALDPRVLAKWFSDYKDSVGGVEGVAKFVAEQALLYALNPTVARIFNPFYFAAMLLPGSMGNVHTTIDTQAGNTMKEYVDRVDGIVSQAIAVTPGKPAGNGTVSNVDLYDNTAKYSDGQAYSVDDIVDSTLDKTGHPFTKDETIVGLGSIKRFDATKFFQERDSSGGSAVQWAAAIARAKANNVNNGGLAQSAFVDGVVRVRVPNEEQDGSVLWSNPDPSQLVDDDDTRVPVSFTDLRQIPGSNFRSVYFRPQNLTLSQQYQPDWSESEAYGRVDPLVAYKRTTRTMAVSFEVHAMAPEDLEVMYSKKSWLESMVYPTYGADALMRSGPIIRMRIGDVVGTDLGGLPGVIRSLSFDFADALWELRKGMKVPMAYKVNLEFLALHDGPVGTVDGEFGVFSLPPGGPAPQDTSQQGNPTDSRSSPAQSITRNPGRFSRFGEPRKS